MFAASITRIHCAHMRTTHGKGKHATRTTTQRFSRPMPLLLLYRAPMAAFRSSCTEGCARTIRSTYVGMHNVIREFIWNAATVLFAQVILMRTVYNTYTYVVSRSQPVRPFALHCLQEERWQDYLILMAN